MTEEMRVEIADVSLKDFTYSFSYNRLNKQMSLQLTFFKESQSSLMVISYRNQTRFFDIYGQFIDVAGYSIKIPK
jgi:uncharacterized protein with FMN-binding domain